MQKKKKKSAKAGSQSKANYIKLGDNIWPVERDVLFRPDRLKYVRKLLDDKGCVFCTASKKDISFDTLCVFKSKHSMVVLNKFPYNSGHILVLPLQHKGSMFDLSDAEYNDLHQALRLAMKA